MMVAQQFLLSSQSHLGVDGLVGYDQAMLNHVVMYQSLIDNRSGSVRGHIWAKTRTTCPAFVLLPVLDASTN